MIEHAKRILSHDLLLAHPQLNWNGNDQINMVVVMAARFNVSAQGKFKFKKLGLCFPDPCPEFQEIKSVLIHWI